MQQLCQCPKAGSISCCHALVTACRLLGSSSGAAVKMPCSGPDQQTSVPDAKFHAGQLPDLALSCSPTTGKARPS